MTMILCAEASNEDEHREVHIHRSEPRRILRGLEPLFDEGDVLRELEVMAVEPLTIAVFRQDR